MLDEEKAECLHYHQVTRGSTRDDGDKSNLDRSQRHIAPDPLEHQNTGESVTSSAETITQPESQNVSPQRDILRFEDGDAENPNNWTRQRKLYTLLVAIFFVLNSTIGSTLISGGIDEVARDFNIHDQTLLVLPTSLYLLGYVFGPLAFGPLSETYGRRPIMFIAFAGFTAFTLGCALAPNFAALNVFRLLCGTFGSCPIAVLGGICADVYHDAVYRGRAMALFMTATVAGPVVGPCVSGFVSVVSWRWCFWIGLVLAGVTWALFIFQSETYGPVILLKRARRLRKEDPERYANLKAPLELDEKSLEYIISVVLYRPIKMFISEAIVLSTCLYTGFVYGIFYMFLQAFSIVYGDIYGFNAGEQGLAFIPIGIGAVIACGTFLLWDAYVNKATAQNKKWTHREESRRLPLACICGPCIVLSLFWTGWTARPSIHWIVPVLGGIPFGIGYMLIFISLLNYLTDAYAAYAASANAAAATTRSALGFALPFAAKPMYDKLGVAWACSLLGFVSLGMCAIPFAFIKWGDYIRAHSKFCQELKEAGIKEEEEERVRRSIEIENTKEERVEIGKS